MASLLRQIFLISTILNSNQQFWQANIFPACSCPLIRSNGFTMKCAFCFACKLKLEPSALGFIFYEWGQQNRLTHLLFFSCPICLPKEQQLTAPVRLPLIIYSYLHIITKDGRHLRVSLKARDDVSSVNSRLQSLLPTVPSVQHLPMLSHGASNSLSLSDLLH